MYLEISAPRSGKTYRLLKNAYLFLQKSKNSHICIYSPLQISDLLGIYTLLIKYAERIVCRQSINSGVIPSSHIFSRIYYDEFDELNHALPLIDAYYVTSPSFPRTKEMIVSWEKGKASDKLLSLIAYASLRLDHVVNYDSEMHRHELSLLKEKSERKAAHFDKLIGVLGKFDNVSSNDESEPDLDPYPNAYSPPSPSRHSSPPPQSRFAIFDDDII